MEQLLAVGNGTTFQAHRGAGFLKVIQITTQKQLVVRVKMFQNGQCHVHIRNLKDHAQFAHKRTLKFMWFNAADPTPEVLGKKVPWKEYLTQAIQSEYPDVLMFSSSGRVCSKLEVAAFIPEIGHQQYHASDVGIDGGAFVVSGNGNVVAMLNEPFGCCIQSGIQLDCDWY